MLGIADVSQPCRGADPHRAIAVREEAITLRVIPDQAILFIEAPPQFPIEDDDTLTGPQPYPASGIVTRKVHGGTRNDVCLHPLQVFEC